MGFEPTTPWLQSICCAVLVLQVALFSSEHAASYRVHRPKETQGADALFRGNPVFARFQGAGAVVAAPARLRRRSGGPTDHGLASTERPARICR